MAVSVAATVQGIGLFIALRHSISTLHITPIIKTWLKMFLASLPMGVAVWAISLLGNWQKGGNNLLNITILGLCVAGGVIVYALFSYVFKIQEFKDLIDTVKRRRNQ